MAKKGRFFMLEMSNGQKVGSLSELIKYFDLERAKETVMNGKMEDWLRDRNQEEMAEQISQIDNTTEEFEKKICETILENQAIAYTQDELNNYLEEKKERIYLFDGKFEISTDHGDITYIGLKRPILVVNSETIVDWDEKNIQIEHCDFDENYLKVLHGEEEPVNLPEEIPDVNSERKENKDRSGNEIFIVKDDETCYKIMQLEEDKLRVLLRIEGICKAGKSDSPVFYQNGRIYIKGNSELVIYDIEKQDIQKRLKIEKIEENSILLPYERNGCLYYLSESYGFNFVLNIVDLETGNKVVKNCKWRSEFIIDKHKSNFYVDKEGEKLFFVCSERAFCVSMSSPGADGYLEVEDIVASYQKKKMEKKKMDVFGRNFYFFRKVIWSDETIVGWSGDLQNIRCQIIDIKQETIRDLGILMRVIYEETAKVKKRQRIWPIMNTLGFCDEKLYWITANRSRAYLNTIDLMADDHAGSKKIFLGYSDILAELLSSGYMEIRGDYLYIFPSECSLPNYRIHKEIGEVQKCTSDQGGWIIEEKGSEISIFVSKQDNGKNFIFSSINAK